MRHLSAGVSMLTNFRKLNAVILYIFIKRCWVCSN